MRRVDRALVGGVRPEPRIVHLGAGAFHKSHQATFTWRAPDRAEWGITAFAGRSGADALLAAQDGVFTVVTPHTEGVSAEIVGSICLSRGSSSGAFAQAMADPRTAIATLTVTEDAWALASDGTPAETPDLVADALDIREGRHSELRTMWGKLYAGLERRRDAGASALALVPCDNIPNNGETLRGGLLAFADAVGSGDTRLVDDLASFVSSSVDRITPRTARDEAQRLARAAGYDDRCAVVAERTASWIIAGEFPLGRPAWESAGGEFVSEIGDYDRRKLALLNGAHLVLAAYGVPLGIRSTDVAFAHPVVRERVEAFWREASTTFSMLDPRPYIETLRIRFSEVGGAYPLAQIRAGWRQKLHARIAPIVAERARRGEGSPECAALAEALAALG
ncbi:mannitol dehydrogenase family protein [Salinibacterium sp. ZJ77]|uniref:mannitol dehydrogenase family protein n=1 Tax=Salinibacterium sp. ZJ77 TaxID=2708337 RepID=UPI00141F2C80|nr:mannitol dehydrogenase family protein [Salinibacterium sp. ZJ77]